MEPEVKQELRAKVTDAMSQVNQRQRRGQGERRRQRQKLEAMGMGMRKLLRVVRERKEKESLLLSLLSQLTRETRNVGGLLQSQKQKHVSLRRLRPGLFLLCDKHTKNFF